LLRDGEVLSHKDMVRPCHCKLNHIYTHQNLPGFDVVKIYVFQVEGGTIEDMVTRTQNVIFLGEGGAYALA